MSPGERLFVTVLAAAMGFGAVVWLGAALAALTLGSPAPGGLVAGVKAIPELMKHPGEPALAWVSTSQPVPPRLPGPVVYWLATGVAAIVVVGVLLAGRSLWRMMSPQRQRLGVDAHARFATRSDLRPLLTDEPVPGRFVLGTWGRWLVSTESQRWAPIPRHGVAGVKARITGQRRRGRSGDVTSVAIVGPTRSGKTAECVIPGVLDWEGPAILLSVKRDLMDATIARRRKLGEVRVFDPGGFLAQNQNVAVTVPVAELARWSPLRNADTATGAKRAGEAMASWTPQAGVDGGMNFWTSQGKVLFTGLLGAAALSRGRSMRAVAQWVFNMSMPGEGGICEPEQILKEAMSDASTRQAAESAIMHLAAIWNKPDPKLKSSVYATAVTVCDPWLDPNVIAATDLSDGNGEWVDLDWLLNTGPQGARANTLYLLVSNDDYKRLAPVLAGLLSDLKSQAYQWEMFGRRFPSPLLMLIDEAGNMPLDWLPEVSSTCAGVGIQLVTVWQSLAQIHESYGRRAEILLTNHATKLFFPAASDETTLSYQSKIVGEEEVERRSWTSDIGGGSGRRSISGQDNRESLVPYFLARLPDFGKSLMIHSNTPPAQISGRPWWDIRRLARMVPHAPDPSRRNRPVKNAWDGPWIPTVDEPGTPVPPAGVDAATGEILTSRPAPGLAS